MLDRQQLRLLLADDPGSGKTVMTGLLIKKLVIRDSLERCLTIAPGSLVDEAEHHDGARVLVAMGHAIRDERTTRNGTARTISEQLQFVLLGETEYATDGGPAPYFDCRPTRDEQRTQISELLSAPWLEKCQEDRARMLTISNLVPRHLEEVQGPPLASLDSKVEAAVKERMCREITHLQHRALELNAEGRAGKRPRLNSENMHRQVQAFTDRLEQQLADIARQRDIALLPSEFCSTASVVPAAILREAQEDSETKRNLGHLEYTAEALNWAEVKAKAMAAVMEEELNLGYEPSDEPSEIRVYEIESREPKAGLLRLMEV